MLPKNAKQIDENFLKYRGLSCAKACKSCRSRQELSNSPCPFSQSSFRTDSYSNKYLLAKIGVDTAENEHLKVHFIFKLWDLIFTEPPRPLRGAAVAAVSQLFSSKNRDSD